MSTGIIDIMKRAALDATDNAQMCDLRYGKVVSTSPLKVQVTNLFTIPAALLIVPEHLTDHTVDVSIDWSTDSDGEHNHWFAGETSLDALTGADVNWIHTHQIENYTDDEGEHSHPIKGKKTMTIHNALKVGDKVALLRKQGGQSYFILDRI